MGQQSTNGGSGGGNNGGNSEVCVVRPALTINHRASYCLHTTQHNPGILERLGDKVKSCCKCSGECVKSVITSRIPILSWLPQYSFKQSILGDIIAGVTVAIMHIPQGMAYALLAGIPPIYGLYMAFFPLLIYAVFGTSRHCSMGTFAVVCLMTGKVVGDLATDPSEMTDDMTDSNNSTNSSSTTTQYTPVQVAAVVALTNGIVQIILGCLQLGSLCVFLSDMLVSGFTTGAAVHVLTSQIKYLFGIQVHRYSGPFKIIYTYRDIISELLFSNPAAMVISGITIATLAVNNEVFKPRLKTKTKIPLPIELIVVIVGTVASYFGHLHDKFNIRIVGEIPTGLPAPNVPELSLMPAVLMDAIVISIVAYTVSFSMAKIFAKRHNYNVDATQELYALGLSNMFGSFFGCAPVTASLSRSLIQEAVGGMSQITSFICCSLILLVLLFVGPLFETLPNCVLSSIIVVALKGMFLQVHDLSRIWAVSRLDAVIWITSFLGVVIIDIDYGLLLGIVASLLVLLGRAQQPKTAQLGLIPNTDIYLDISKYSAATEIGTLSIFQFGGPLHFANTEYFRVQLISVTGLDPNTIANTRALLKAKKKEPQENPLEKTDAKETSEPSESNGTAKGKNKLLEFIRSKKKKNETKEVSLTVPEVRYLVLEISSVSYVDSSGGNLLKQLYKEFRGAGIYMCLAGASESVLESLQTCGTLKAIPNDYIFHSTHDAVTILTKSSQSSSSSSSSSSPSPNNTKL